ncbi:MAG: hypothetical protein LBB43_02080 [Spirochaetaceae bacterium]|jgi:hypothetical protein|nr:hypothetical protein [Spirochaetaceae bacterium]
MSDDKKTAIYEQDDSADELEEYGVWITNKTQDEVSANTKGKSESEENADFSWNVLDGEPSTEGGELSDTEKANEDSGVSSDDIPSFEEKDALADDGENTMVEPSVVDELLVEEPLEPEIAVEQVSEPSDNADESKDFFGVTEEIPVLQEQDEDSSVSSDDIPSFEQSDVSTDDGENTMIEPSVVDELPVEEPLEPEIAVKQANEPSDNTNKSKDFFGITEEIPVLQEQDDTDKVSQLLKSVVQELRLIHEELTVLRRELLSNKERKEIPVETPAPLEAPAKSEGFFDEEDDEKIALTGDELENILMTSDFTEETGSDAALELESDDETPSLLFEEVDYSPTDDAETSEVEDAALIQAQDMAYLEEDPFVDDESLPDEQTEDLESSNNNAPDNFFDLDSIIEISVAEAKNETGELEIKTPPEKVDEESENDDGSIDDSSLDDELIDEDLSEDLLNSDTLAEDELLGGISKPEPQPAQETVSEAAPAAKTDGTDAFFIPSSIKDELSVVLCYMDQLLEALPDEKIEEFAHSEYFDTYKKLFKELGLG